MPDIQQSIWNFGVWESSKHLIPTAFFNGLDFTDKSTYTGGPTVVADHDGVLNAGVLGMPSIAGARVLRTLAEYAAAGIDPVFGNELWTDTATIGGSWTRIGVNTYSNNGTDTYKQVTSTVTAVKGRTYQVTYTVSDYVSGSVKLLYISGPGYTERSANGEYTETVVCGASGGLRIQSRASGFNAKVTLNSWKELLPTYIDTEVDGSPIVPWTQQKTRTGNVDFSVFSVGTTFKRYASADPATLPGWLCEPSRTNLCTSQKVNPTATTDISKTSGTGTLSVESGKESLIAAAGLQNICTSGVLYKYVAATDSVLGFGGYPGVDTSCSGSIFVAVESGSAFLRMSGANLVSTTNPNLVRVIYENRAVTSSDPLALFVAAGSTVYFIGMQYEVGAFVSSLMFNTNDAL